MRCWTEAAQSPINRADRRFGCKAPSSERTRWVSHDVFSQFVERHGLSRAAVQRITEKHRNTVKAWFDGRPGFRVPIESFDALKVHVANLRAADDPSIATTAEQYEAMRERIMNAVRETA